MKAKKIAVKPNLTREVAARTRFLKKVIDFAESITNQLGRLLHRAVDSRHTHTIFELHNFGKFSFYVDTNKTMFGGNTVKVWYHPAKKYVPADSDLVPVLDISWGIDINNPTHLRFNDEPDWQLEILKVIQNQKIIARRICREAATAKKRALANCEKAKREQDLVEMAQRLQVY